MSQPLTVEVYYDFYCPFAYEGSIWLNDVKERLGDEVIFVWKAFPLEQVNSTHGPEWTVWGQPESVQSFTRNQFAGAYAAENQGAEAAERFRTALFTLHHEQGKVPGKRDTLIEAATQAGLDIDRFENDLADTSLWARIGEDYLEGKQKGVFGTPTLVFPNGSPIYVKMRPAAPREDALNVWSQVLSMAGQTYLAELKKGNPPVHHEDGKVKGRVAAGVA
jgi:predicted DsbA family dithiol-disulfide isomerase